MQRTCLQSAVTLAIALLALAAPVLAAKSPQIALRGNGLLAGKTSLVFGQTSRTSAIAAVTAELGKPLKTGSHGDCGQGAVVTYAKFRGGFELSFVKNRLSGWTEDETMLATDKGIRVGSTVSALRTAYRNLFLDPGDEANGGVGPGFQREGGPNGWLDGTKPTSRITGLFAGATCLPGI